LQSIRAAQQERVEIADRPIADEATPPAAPTMEQFLAGLRTAWREGEVRPTSKPKEKAPRGRRRPDPFVRDGSDARAVRGRAVADIARIVRAAAS